jgi:DNA-binding IclR family transcriptional regulator
MSYLVDSVDSAMRLLTCIAEHPGLGVTELASRLALNKSRTYRMVRTLQHHQLVLLDPRNATYVLGPQAAFLGGAASRQIPIAQAIAQALRA